MFVASLLYARRRTIPILWTPYWYKTSYLETLLRSAPGPCFALLPMHSRIMPIQRRIPPTIVGLLFWRPPERMAPPGISGPTHPYRSPGTKESKPPLTTRCPFPGRHLVLCAKALGFLCGGEGQNQTTMHRASIDETFIHGASYSLTSRAFNNGLSARGLGFNV